MASVQGFNLFTQLYLHGFREKKLSKRLIVGVTHERQNNLYVDEEKVDRKKPKILIAGGGIGGLVFALAAKKSGFDVQVFEKDLTAVRGEGRDHGPIQLLSSALGLLESMDKNVATEIMEAGYVTGDRSNGLADGRTGEWFVKLDFRTPAVEKGIPVTQIICRIELQRILLKAVGDDTVINNSKVVDFVCDANKVTIFLENGQKHEGDILVGADGIRLWYKIFVGKNQYFVALDIGKGRMQWYAYVKEACESSLPSTGNKNLLVECFGDWCNEVNRIVNRTAEHMIIRRPIHDIDMTNTWGKGRVILLGDAAHAMLPNLGQGGSMAIEDCYWLMLELRNLADGHLFSERPLHELELAFKRFEKKRMFRVRTVHSVCRIASVMTSFYQTYLVDIGPLPSFNLPTIRLKHPAFLVSSMVLQLAFPKFMDWVVVGQE